MTKTKFLWVIKDNELNWKAHISYISGKISRAIGVIIKAHNFGKGALLSLYYTLIFLYLTYCNITCGSTYKYNIDRLTKLQKNAARSICSVKPYSHTDGLYKELGLVKVTEIYKFWWDNSCSDIIIKCYPNFDEYFTKHSEAHGYSTGKWELFWLPDYKKDLRRRCISFIGVKYWTNCCCGHRFRYIATSF